MEESTTLLKATSEYEKTMVGAFHTAVHFDDMKKHLAVIEEIKVAWTELFAPKTSRMEEVDQ